MSSLVTPYQIAWNNPGFGSAQRLVPILLAGDDYNRALSSFLLGSFTGINDRLSSLEDTIALETFYAQNVLSGLTWEFRKGLTHVSRRKLRPSAACLQVRR